MVGSLFFKKFILILIGLTCFLILLKDKSNYKYYLIFLIINFWIVIASLKQLLNFNYYGDSDNIRYFDFIKQLIISGSIYFSVLFVIKNNGIIKTAKELLIIILLFIVTSTYYLIYAVDYNFGDTLYGLIININNGEFSWHWGSAIGLVGVVMPLYLIGFKKNSIMVDVLFLISIGLYASLLESRTLILYLLLFYIYIIYRKNKYYAILSILLIFNFLYFSIDTLSDISSFQRLNNTVGTNNILAETRFQLYKDFFSFVRLENIFGTLETAAKYTNESLESFHNTFMDSFWYSGYFGFFATIVSFLFLVKIFICMNNWFYKITLLFVLLGFLFGAPPFSDIFALNLIFPFLFIKYFEDIEFKNMKNASK